MPGRSKYVSSNVDGAARAKNEHGGEVQRRVLGIPAASLEEANKRTKFWRDMFTFGPRSALGASMIKSLYQTLNPVKIWYMYATWRAVNYMCIMTLVFVCLVLDIVSDIAHSHPLRGALRWMGKTIFGERFMGPDPAPTNLRDAYAPMFAHRPDEWKQIPYGGETYADEAFADQQLNGCQPYFIRRVDGDVAALQEKIRITDAEAAAVVGRGTTLSDLIKDDRLFIIDTSPFFEGLWEHPALQGVCNAVPVALFYIHVDHTQPKKEWLMPLAIQLFPGEGRAGYANPVFTPKDDANVWLAAKMFVNNALACVHATGQHITYASACSSMAIVARGCFPHNMCRGKSDPPIDTGIKLLDKAAHILKATLLRWFPDPVRNPPHPLGDLAFGFSDYAVQLQSTTPFLPPFPEWKFTLLKMNWQRYNLCYMNVPKDIDQRGVRGIPHYHWRDESEALYKVFEKFVRAIVDATYESDEDVKADGYLTLFAKELEEKLNVGCRVVHYTFPAARRAATMGAATVGGDSSQSADEVMFDSKQVVVDYFTVFCYYAASRFSYDTQQWPWYIWIPATPLNFNLEPMTTKEPIEFSSVLMAMDPPFSGAASFQRASIRSVKAIGKWSQLTTGGEDAHRVPLLPLWLQSSPNIIAARETFYRDLDELEREMRSRDDKRAGAGHRRFDLLYPTRQFASAWY